MKLYQPSRDEARCDYREDELFVTIEHLRSQLLEVAKERSLSDNTVLELSQRLDSYIVLAQNKMMENLRGRKHNRVRGKALIQ
ncbi:aspartyl-phosphate phosphatase Spo0E family protein [Paenibacillus tepidiphilus]|uniref:aspartyl-phosphate phosphatase Spo0E family protein n=1 Tax=Paenibacillus tepidiphilus TaxID=2608683 RepID=UPI001239D555|nr:aspartyl-phosphate phosphatase Spo0E family protein [Paenibacillus tepidiphilus]